MRNEKLPILVILTKILNEVHSKNLTGLWSPSSTKEVVNMLWNVADIRNDLFQNLNFISLSPFQCSMLPKNPALCVTSICASWIRIQSPMFVRAPVYPAVSDILEPNFHPNSFFLPNLRMWYSKDLPFPKKISEYLEEYLTSRIKMRHGKHIKTVMAKEITKGTKVFITSACLFENNGEKSVWAAGRPAVTTLSKSLYLRNYVSDLHALFTEW